MDSDRKQTYFRVSLLQNLQRKTYLASLGKLSSSLQTHRSGSMSVFHQFQLTKCLFPPECIFTSPLTFPFIFYKVLTLFWGYSSAGRAHGSYPCGHRSESYCPYSNGHSCNDRFFLLFIF